MRGKGARRSTLGRRLHDTKQILRDLTTSFSCAIETAYDDAVQILRGQIIRLELDPYSNLSLLLELDEALDDEDEHNAVL